MSLARSPRASLGVNVARSRILARRALEETLDRRVERAGSRILFQWSGSWAHEPFLRSHNIR